MNEIREPKSFEEKYVEHIEVAEKAMRDLLGFDSKREDFSTEDRLLIIVSKDAEEYERELAQVVSLAGRRISAENVDVIEIEEDFEEEEAIELAKKYPFIFNISAISHRGNLFSQVQEHQNRLVSPIGANVDLFSPDGTLNESAAIVSERLKSMHEILRKGYGFKIKTKNGTDIQVRMKEGRRWSLADGVIKKGLWDNWPSGEIYTTPDEFGVNGRMVLYAVDTADSQFEQAKDEPVVIELKNGSIVSITGGILAEKLKAEFLRFMDENRKGINREELINKGVSELEISELERDIPWNVLRVAEIGFGALRNARYSNIDGSSVPTVEAEKRLGTVHIGIGSGDHEEDGVSGFFDSLNHYDFVIEPGVEIEMFESEDDFRSGKNGRTIIKNGGFIFS